ncbi:hypothetical protein [Picosynechococcus sp. NKBG042902]|uniref:hypothetical protein n=1 Tax=Picosynechococcus sp. NKBG042902 TaxID=490193 RepID=UPI000694927B|nr:hypothetical protein [Picosynechococcus sp. NKBG042902]
MRIFLDTNVYIVGQLEQHSPENRILIWLEQNSRNPEIQVVISQELIDQVLRVGKRLKNKDWAAGIVAKIWHNLNHLFIAETNEMRQEAALLCTQQTIPAEDISIYVGAKFGRTDYFVSANRQLIKSIADFQCLTAEDFVTRFLP